MTHNKAGTVDSRIPLEIFYFDTKDFYLHERSH